VSKFDTPRELTIRLQDYGTTDYGRRTTGTTRRRTANAKTLKGTTVDYGTTNHGTQSQRTEDGGRRTGLGQKKQAGLLDQPDEQQEFLSLIWLY